MAHPDDEPTPEEKRQPEPGDRRVSERRLFPPRPEGRRHDGGRRREDEVEA